MGDDWEVRWGAVGGGMGMCASGGCSHVSVVDGGAAFVLELMIVMGVSQSWMGVCELA